MNLTGAGEFMCCLLLILCLCNCDKNILLLCCIIGGVPATNQVVVAPPLNTLDLEQEREKIRQEYEARISQLTVQYTEEQRNSFQLQEQLKKTREAYEQQLADLNDTAMSQVVGECVVFIFINLLVAAS